MLVQNYTELLVAGKD